MDLRKVAEFAATRGYGVSRTDAATRFVRDASPYRVEVVVPHEVYEWFVEVFDEQGRKVFSDWCDHYGTTPTGELEAERASSISDLIDCVQPGRFRMNSPRLEILDGDQWIDVWAYQRPSR